MKAAASKIPFNRARTCKPNFVLTTLNHSNSTKFSRILFFVGPVANAELADQPLRLLIGKYFVGWIH